MPNHNIYIYANQGSGNNGGNTQFTPFGARDKDGMSGDQIMSAYGKVSSFANGGFSSAINGGIGMLVRASPYIAAAVVAAKVTDKVVTTGFDHLEEYVGDYRFDMAWNNFKTSLTNSINPVGLMFKQAHRHFQFQKRNKEIQMQRTLIGNTLINDGKIGV